MFEGYQSESEVSKICKKYDIENWYLEGGLVNVEGSVYLSRNELTELPLKFGTVTGYFDCSVNNLSSLEGCPIRVGGSFDCAWNNLSSLVGCPRSVGDDFYCSRNNLRSLVGCPRSVGGDFWCRRNNISEFTGIGYIGDQLFCSGNPIMNIWSIISPNFEWNEEDMDFFEDCQVIQDDGEAVAIDRLNFFLKEIGLEPVEKVEGYINI